MVAIDEALLQSSTDPEKLESLLKMGLDAGVPDEVLLQGITRMSELRQAKQAEAAAEETAARAEAEKKAEEEAVARALKQPAPTEGSLVALHNLKEGRGPFGLGGLNLEKHNGRVGRVVSNPPTSLVVTAVEHDSMPADPSARRLANRLVFVHSGICSSDSDRRHGLWLAVPLRYTELQ